MEEDKIALQESSTSIKSEIIEQTRSKFDSLLEDALSSKKSKSRNKKGKRIKNKLSTPKLDNDSTSIEMVVNTRKLAPLKIKTKNVQEEFNMKNDTIISIPEEIENEMSPEVIESTAETTQIVSPTKSARSSKKDRKHSITSPVVQNGCMNIKLHGVNGLKNDRDIVLRAHVIDTESGTALMTSQETTSAPLNNSANYWKVDKELSFPSPLQLAVETQGTIIFIEILTSSTSQLLSCYSLLDSEEKCLSWCFLKLRGSLNCNKQLRLQLYEPMLRRHTSKDFKLVHGWWCKGIWRKIPAWLDVTVCAQSAEKLNNNDANKSVSENGENLNEIEAQDTKEADNIEAPVTSQRKAGQLCKVPNKQSFALSPKTSQCLVMAFSPSGNKLACASTQNIFVFKVNSGFKEACSLQGHEGLIYDLFWLNDVHLFSASADCMVIQWNVKLKSVLQILPHPTFVYCCRMSNNDVITGSKDAIIRIWRQQPSGYDLWQELEGHEGFVTSLHCLSDSVTVSADSEGSVIMWNKHSEDWHKLREIIQINVAINKILVHPGGSRLIIHARDSLVRCVDISTGAVMQQYSSGTYKVQTGCSISPCGSLLFVGTEEGSVLVWQLDTGRLLSTLTPDNHCPPATALEYHPHQHLMVSAYFGHPLTPVNVWKHDSSGNDKIEEEISSIPTISLAKEQVKLNDIIARIDRVFTK